MLSALINGVSITNDNYWPIKVGKGFMPEILHSSSAIGNKDGVALGTPYYKNISLIMEILVKGDSLSDMVVKRDGLMKLFRLNADRSQKTKLLTIVDNAGQTKSINFVTQSVSSEDTPDKKNWSIVTVGLQADKEYYHGLDQTGDVFISTGGGFSVPFALPFDMSIGAESASVEFINGGNTESFPTMRVYGDMTSFNIVNDDTGQTISCTESLGGGDYIDFDFYNQTAVKNGSTNVLNTISANTDRWLYFQPGSNKISLATISTSSVAHIEVTHQNAYLNL